MLRFTKLRCSPQMRPSQKTFLNPLKHGSISGQEGHQMLPERSRILPSKGPPSNIYSIYLTGWVWGTTSSCTSQVFGFCKCSVFPLNLSRAAPRSWTSSRLPVAQQLHATPIETMYPIVYQYLYKYIQQIHH